MELPLLIFLSMALVTSHAAVAPEVYWKSMLPKTPMPKAVTDLLHNEWMEDKSTNVGVGKGGVSVNAPGTQVGVVRGGVVVHTPGTLVGAGRGGVSVNTPGTNVGVGRGGVSVNTPGTYVGVGRGGVAVYPKSKPRKCSSVNVGKKGVIVRCDPTTKPVYAPFSYRYAANEDQLKDNPNVALFFLEHDMHQGVKMNLHFTKMTSPSATFLPREVADSLPFSSRKFPEIFEQLSVKPDSIEAEYIKKTINECEDKGIKGEEKYCATSLESMVDFSTSKLGKHVKAVSTEINTKKSTPLQEYKIEGWKKLATNKAVVCHKQNYAYAIFYCHKTISTRAYSVSLVGSDGTKAKAVAVCHTDTAKWNPKHLAFQVLKVKPGTLPICHFLPEDHVVWIPY